MSKKYRIVLCLILLTIKLRSQNKILPDITVKTHVYKDGVAIRWTPANLYLWRKWSKSGYRIERYTIGKNGISVNDGESVLLGGESIVPFNDSSWMEFAFKVPQVNLIRYCLTNDTSHKMNNKEDFYTAQTESEQCYIFSMLAMQSKFELAIAGGIGFIDNKTNNNEIYLYKLYPVNANKKDTQRFIVDMHETSELPIINGFSSTIKDQRILLEWNAQPYHSYYFGFQIERSVDGGQTYRPLSTVPIVPTISGEGVQRKKELFSDTIYHYYKPVYYRIRGMSYFGQYGESSPVDSIIALPETIEFPKFLEVENNTNNFSKITWQFEKKEEHLIKGFKILISDSSEGKFTELDSVLIDANERISVLKINKNIAYIKMAAICLNNTCNTSFPVMVQQTDSMAPTPPQLLSLSVDTNGIAILQWSANKEKDFMAYLIYKGNDRNQEFSSITSQYFKDTTISDTLYNNMLRDSIYFKVTAIDGRYNESKYSEIIAAAIPNKIPPSPPYIFEIKKDSKHAFIQWHQSNSNDVAYYKLYREQMTTNEIQIVKINKEAFNYKDSLVISGEIYHYTLQAVDYTGLVSKISNPYEVKIPHEKLMPVVMIDAIINDSNSNHLSLYWSYPYDAEVSHYRVIQNKDDGNIQTIGTVGAGTKFYNYYYLKPYSMTTYYIIAYFKDGRRSKI